jgi:hypothetical protein
MMDKVQKPSINECYTPSSEPYRVYPRDRWQFDNVYLKRIQLSISVCTVLYSKKCQVLPLKSLWILCAVKKGVRKITEMQEVYEKGGNSMKHSLALK